MKYSDLISFHPIEDVIQLVTAENKDKAREYVKTYVMSDTMAESLQAPVLDQLQMDEVVDNKGVLIVGNYGTGKSHLMSVLSAIATDADNVQYLQNKKFAEQVKPIAGKFEVLRIEIGGVVMPLYDVIMGYVQDDFEKRGIDFEVPDYKSVKSIKTVSPSLRSIRTRDISSSWMSSCPTCPLVMNARSFSIWSSSALWARCAPSPRCA